MKKSPNAGLSGAVRVQQLKLSDLTMAEKHGKRMDATSRARRISRDAPLSTTGLNLHELHRYHLKDVFVPKAKSKAMHVIIQFPKDLVDGEKPALMLRHARAFVEDVFGPDAIFADRVDRDERGRHIVDVFVAPKYTKITKHQQKTAVTMSRHLKALAVKHDRPTTPRGTGHALQDALFAYFRDVMNLPGVQRGSPKTIAGPDWLSAEQLRDQELQEQRSDLQRERSELERRSRSVADQEKQTASASEETETERRAARHDRDLAKAEIEGAIKDADAVRREADAERERQAEADRAARREMELQQAELLVSAANANSEAVAERARAKKLSQHMASEEQQLSIAKAEIAAMSAAARLERESDAARRRLEQSQLGLLERASDDEQGLHLRANGQNFEMNEGKMTPDERQAYTSPWSNILRNMALKLAVVLDRIREMARRVREREQVANDRIAEAENRERDADRRALEIIAGDRKILNDQKAAFNLEQASHKSKLEALERRQVTLESSEKENRLWAVVTQMLVASTVKFEISPSGSLRLSDAEKLEAEPAFVAFLKNEPPEWVKSVARQQRQVSTILTNLRQKESLAEKKVTELSNIVARLGPVLTNQQMAAAAVARKVIRQHGTPPQDMER